MHLNQFRPQLRQKVAALQEVLGYHPGVFCLVTGSPRSGTTAVVRWLGKQSGITVFSESRILVGTHALLQEVHRFRSLHKNEPSISTALRRMVFGYYAERRNYSNHDILVDKEPLEPIAFPDQQYTSFLSNVRSLVPNVKILIMIRDPVATVWSMMQRKWGYSLRGEEPRTFALEDHVANWCACADIVLSCASDPSTYVCQYGKLTMEPEGESARIAKFLSLDSFEHFQPKPSAEPAFTPQEHSLVTSRTRDRVEALAAVGLLAL